MIDYYHITVPPMLLALWVALLFVVYYFLRHRQEYEFRHQEIEFRRELERMDREDRRISREFAEKREASEINHRQGMEKEKASHDREMDKLRLAAVVKCHTLSVLAGRTDTQDALDQLSDELEEACRNPTVPSGSATPAT